MAYKPLLAIYNSDDTGSYYGEYDGTWIIERVGDGYNSTDVLRIGDHINVNHKWRSLDGGGTWAEHGFMPPYANAEAVIYEDVPYYVYIDTANKNLKISTNYGTSYLITKSIPVPATGTWTITSQKIKQNGEVYVLLTTSTTGGYGNIYFTCTHDLGDTWSTPVAAFPTAPVAWTGGTIHQTSGRPYVRVDFHADGDNVAVVAVEGWTEQKYVAVYNDFYYMPLGAGYYDDQEARYTPTDLLVSVSTDGGLTWPAAPTRIKMDQQQDLAGGGTYAWGYHTPTGIGSPMWPGNSGVRVFSRGTTLYVLVRMVEIYKRMGGELRDPPPYWDWATDADGPSYKGWFGLFAGANWSPNISKIDEFTDYEIGTSFQYGGISGSLVKRVSDDSSESFILAQTNTGTGTWEGILYEVMHNGVFTLVPLMTGTPDVVTFSYDVSFMLWDREGAYTWYF